MAYLRTFCADVPLCNLRRMGPRCRHSDVPSYLLLHLFHILPLWSSSDGFRLFTIRPRAW
jgi:hypothetical protein